MDEAWRDSPGSATDHLVEVAPGVWVEPHVDYEIADIEGITGTIVFAARRGGFECVSLELHHGGEAITSEKLRAIPIGKIAREVLQREAMAVDPGEDLPLMNPTDLGKIPDNLLRTWPRGDTSVLLSRVAFVYELAQALGDYPVSAVQKATGKSRATANRMVSAAREKGFIRDRADDEIQQAFADQFHAGDKDALRKSRDEHQERLDAMHERIATELSREDANDVQTEA
ncbi:Uncharacterised protein [Brevibacterium casei]|uniref:Uncharacterized protein n=2 Tax=Brevibacterium casei TaxID=33889 RepID=A0A449CYG0_9MICO|nr:Uncharacterised protein [Brevibacterium casei]